MGTITRRRAIGYGRWLVDWKHGLVVGRDAPVWREESMSHEILTRFFSRYPSALGSTSAGGQYQIICPECGHMVPVAVLDEHTHSLRIHCDHCDYDDEISDEAKAAVASAA